MKAGLEDIPFLKELASLFMNTYRRIHVFIGDPIDPMSENIMEELKELTDKKEYKKIIYKITEELKKELFAKQIRMGSSSCQC